MAAAKKKVDTSEIRKIFNELDLDKNGMLDLEEFEEAIKMLGLNSSEVDKAFSIVSGIKRRKNWEDMSDSVQSSWQALGFNKSNWGGTSSTDDKSWKDLSEEQKEAAMSLGYTSDVWDSSEAKVKTDMRSKLCKNDEFHDRSTTPISRGRAGGGITFKMLTDAIQSASELQVTMTRVLTRQMSSLNKRSKIEAIRELMAQREPGRRKNAQRIAEIRKLYTPNKRLNGGAGGVSAPAPPKKVDHIQSEKKRQQVDYLKKKYGVSS